MSGKRSLRPETGPDPGPPDRATLLSFRLSQLAVEAQLVADQLGAIDLDCGQAELQLGQPAALLAGVLETLEEGIYRSELLDLREQARRLEVAKVIAHTGGRRAVTAPPGGRGAQICRNPFGRGERG